MSPSSRLVLLLAARASAVVWTGDNPLLARLDEAFPPWEEIRAEHLQPAARKYIAEARAEFESLEAAVAGVGFVPGTDTLFEPYRLLGDRLNRAYSIVDHLQSVKDSPEIRAAVEAVQPDVIAFYDTVSHSKPIYGAFKAVRDNPALFNALSPAQQRSVNLELQGFELNGVGLDGPAKEEFTKIALRKSKISNDFSNNVLDSTKSWKKIVDNMDDVKGLPQPVLNLAAEAFTQEMKEKSSLLSSSEGQAPGYLFKLDAPTVSAVLTYAESAPLREEVYRAYISGASELRGPNNEPVLKEILELRDRQAKLLNFNNYAELSMERKMATVTTAEELLEKLRAISRPKAEADLADLRQFAAAGGHVGDLNPWDTSYWSHKQVKEEFGIDEEELRPYFPLERCLEGMFHLAKELFDVDFKPATGPKWHKDVMLYAVYDGADTQTPRAHLYFDLFARPSEKRSGAWQMGLADYDSVRGKSPVAAIVANMRPPKAGESALLSFDELHTLFHEFGHSLQHMLTKQEMPALSGLQGVEWDAVELASQFMEYWLDEADWVVRGIAKHHETGEGIPDEKLAKLKGASNHHAGLGMLRQLRLSIVDLDLHLHPFKPGETATQRETEVAMRNNTMLMAKLPEDRFLNGFSHIFAGGYAAGYYSYKWAEVLSADAFSRFQEEGATGPGPQGQAQRRSVGAEFARTVLGEGGGRKAEEIFESFRKRPPSTDALIKYTFPPAKKTGLEGFFRAVMKTVAGGSVARSRQ